MLTRPKMLGAAGVLAVLALLLAGCTGGAYQSPADQQTYYPAIGAEIPPSFYDNDPALEHWYTAPYWNPEASP